MTEKTVFVWIYQIIFLLQSQLNSSDYCYDTEVEHKPL